MASAGRESDLQRLVHLGLDAPRGGGFLALCPTTVWLWDADSGVLKTRLEDLATWFILGSVEEALSDGRGRIVGRRHTSASK